jgi:hypothetical protein
MGSCQPDDFTGVCVSAAVPGTTLCLRHFRGLTLAALDRRHWPRLRMPGGGSVAGDDAWRLWLREASGEGLLVLLQMLGEAPLRDEERMTKLHGASRRPVPGRKLQRFSPKETAGSDFFQFAKLGEGVV